MDKPVHYCRFTDIQQVLLTLSFHYQKGPKHCLTGSSKIEGTTEILVPVDYRTILTQERVSRKQLKIFFNHWTRLLALP